MGKNVKLIAKTLFGLEEVLAQELKQLGALHIEKGTRMVSFEGDLGFIYKANLGLRTAIKVLRPLIAFEVANEQDLYAKTKAIAWDKLLTLEQTFAIDATVHSEQFTHSKYVALKCKDAIADYFREKFQARPNVDTESPDLRLNIHIYQNHCTISIDSSGHSLHMRGYRTQTNVAPINEVLAAGILLLSGWRGQSDFLDPMCGSGTLLIEAAMIACGIPPNIHRKDFAFMRWPDWDEELFDTIREALMRRTREFRHNLYGYDISIASVRKAQHNIVNAGLEEYIHVSVQNFFKSQKKSEGPLFIVFNPPYDERISIDTESFYKHIGDTLKQYYQNASAWLISGNLEATKFIGLRTSRKIKLFNGNIESRLLHYELYEGSKKRAAKDDG